MAYTTGTATDYQDLLATLYTFATANSWVGLEQSTTRIYLKGPGIASLDEIFVGVETFENSSSGYYNWELFGSVSWKTGREPGAQPMSSGSDNAFVYLWDTNIPYWISVTPRRIILKAKVSTVYQTCHLGLLDVPGTDAQYPYPLLIAGNGSTRAQSYSTATINNSAFWSANTRAGRLFLPGGGWANLYAASQSTPTVNAYVVTENQSNKNNMLTAPDGTYKPEAFSVVDYSGQNIFGFIDGLSRVSGYQNSAENIITIDGVNHMVFPDTFRVGYGDYCLLRMT